MWLLGAALAALLTYVLGGLDDERRRRAEARAEQLHASQTRHPAGRRAAATTLPIPGQRDGSNR